MEIVQIADSSSSSPAPSLSHNLPIPENTKKTYIRFLLSDAEAGSVIIGINQFQSQSGAWIQLTHRKEFFPGTSERIMKVDGTISDILKAVELIHNKLQEEFYLDGGDDDNQSSELKLVVPSRSCTRIIGKGGFTIRSFIEESKAGIRILRKDTNSVDLDDRVLTLTGTLEQKKRAMDLILSKLAEDTHYTESFILPSVHANLSNEVRSMPEEVLALPNSLGWTVLHEAAYVDNLMAAKELVRRNENLPYVRDRDGKLPILYSLEFGSRELFSYMLGVSGNIGDEDCERILNHMIHAGYYDSALTLVQERPKVACMVPCPLMAIVGHPYAFRSGTCLNFWKNLIYLCVPLVLGNSANHNNGGDIENPAGSSISGVAYVKQRLCAIFWEVAKMFVPQTSHIQKDKLKHHQALQLVKGLCMEINKSNFSNAAIIYEPILFEATRVGIHEIVDEILASCKAAICCQNLIKQNILQYAILQRRAKVVDLIYTHANEHTTKLLNNLDTSKNNALHLAGFLEPQPEFRLKVSAAGSALQMQQELHWFKEVEEFVKPAHRHVLNAEGKTPAEIFSHTHKELMKEGEKMMKDTATSCTIVAVLIATLCFAATITVPGGNNDSGLPILEKEIVFSIFFVANTIAFFSSISSVIAFLGMLTCRYAEKDFLFSLPKRLIVGLVTLFISFISLMVTFAAAFYLVFGHGHKKAWVFIPVLAPLCLPTTLFIASQFSLLVDMIKSTYGPRILRKIDRKIQ